MFNKLKKAVGKKLLERYKRNKQKSFNGSLNHCLNTARQMLKKSKYCFFITNCDGEWPSARMVQPIIDFKTFDVWIGTNPILRKVKEIEKNPNVTLAFGNDHENANLIIYGTAHLVRDVQEKKKHWIGSWILFFPNGPKGDDFISVRIEPSKMELMNFKRNVVPEPFGLKPVIMTRINGNWQI